MSIKSSFFCPLLTNMYPFYMPLCFLFFNYWVFAECWPELGVVEHPLVQKECTTSRRIQDIWGERTMQVKAYDCIMKCQKLTNSPVTSQKAVQRLDSHGCWPVSVTHHTWPTSWHDRWWVTLGQLIWERHSYQHGFHSIFIITEVRFKNHVPCSASKKKVNIHRAQLPHRVNTQDANT